MIYIFNAINKIKKFCTARKSGLHLTRSWSVFLFSLFFVFVSFNIYFPDFVSSLHFFRPSFIYLFLKSLLFHSSSWICSNLLHLCSVSMVLYVWAWQQICLDSPLPIFHPKHGQVKESSFKSKIQLHFVLCQRICI